MSLDIRKVRKDFPFFSNEKRQDHCVYLDSAATTQKPRCVIERISRYYEYENANVSRGIYDLSHRATEMFEGGRRQIAGFIGARKEEEVVFVRGVTEGINLLANTFGEQLVGPGDEILVTEMEHHSNLVPWHLLAKRKGASIKAVPVQADGTLEMSSLSQLVGERTKLLAISHVSNALGTINPIKEIVSSAHQQGIPVIVDGAQAAPHLKIDVQDLDCDFYLFSGHKVYAPMGIGILYGKYSHLEKMPPYHGGGDMIVSVDIDTSSYREPPYRFEAGTPNVAGVIGLSEALSYLSTVGLENIALHEADLIQYALKRFSELEGLRILGNAPQRASVISFILDFAHPHDAATILNESGVAVRTGHLCVQPLLARMEVPAMIRCSFGMYNTREDVDCLMEALLKVRELFR